MRRTLQHPARLVPLAFLGAVVVGTLLMMIPGARVEPGATPFVTALFTATSAVCVTGLAVVDTATYWTGFGQVLLTVLTQVGGFGIMALATLLALLVSQRLGLRSRIALTQAGFELAIAAVVGARFWLGYDYSIGKAAWYGVFHAVQAFNNAGFALFSNSLVGFVDDPWICVPLTIGVIAGGIGYPVLFELFREIGRPATWSTHTRLTVVGGVVLLVFGFFAVLALEWDNPGTLGPLGVGEKMLAAFFQDAMTRSGGFNTVDVGAFHTETLALSTALMFIGGGSASTAGGIKLTTFFLLAFVILAELRGEPDVMIGKRRIAESTQRQAVTVALLGVGLVAAGTFALLEATTDVALDAALFEVTSAFATVGLSTGITPSLPANAQIILVVLMFIGRVGTIAVGSAIALNTQRRLYRYPEERPIVG
jgi:trk system potassium uptake protein TrkH